MKNRILLKEIPSGKFHSAIFTTFSVNLYYFEQQVLPLLGSKGIHYISVLADSNMLNDQLNAFSILSQKRKRNYALYGMQSDGAFHPKIILLAGESSLLLLIGSGNLTSSGHGKNLEVWNAVYVDNSYDSKLGLIMQAWNYLKNLHIDLGAAAIHKIKSIEENCSLLTNGNKVIIQDSYTINPTTSISFLAGSGNNSIYTQLSDLINREQFDRITIMSPYYDTAGKLIHSLNKRFKPSAINIIVQENFGNVPMDIKPAVNMHFYDWEDVQSAEIKQSFFHAKNIIFEGKNQNYLLSGSANASLAAFGSDDISMVNHEACILYKSKTINFIKLLDINLKSKRIKITDFDNTSDSIENQKPGNQKIIFIKSIERNYDNVTIYISSKKKIIAATVCLFNTKGDLQLEAGIDIEKETTSFQIAIPNDLSLMYGEIINKTNSVSNKQFITDVNAFENTNPSPRNRSLNQIRKLIESGDFSTPKIIDYLNTISSQKKTKKIDNTNGAKNEEEKKNDVIIEAESDLLYLSYEEIQKKIKELVVSQKGKAYIEYKSIRLWESIYSYLKESLEKEKQSKIDEEETEDINKSSGRTESNKTKVKNPISKSNYERLKLKVEKFLSTYLDILESKINNSKAEKPSLIDLSMLLIMLEILFHLLSHKEMIDGEENERYLIEIPFSNTEYSWSDYIIQFIGLFTLWTAQKEGFNEVESEEYTFKLNLYKKMAYKTSICALSLFSSVNKLYMPDKISVWRNLGLLNANLTFNPDSIKHIDMDEFEEFIPKDVMEFIGEYNFRDEISSAINFLENTTDELTNTGNDFYLHPDDGYTLINKVISNNKTQLVFYKLFRIGYDWDEDLREYWNGKLYNVSQNKWMVAM